MEHYNYTGGILSELNEEEVKRLSPLLLYLSLIGLFGIPGNSFVIYAFRKIWRTSNSKLFFIWLAIIDLFNCSVALPLEFVNVVNPYTFHYEWLCKMTIFSSYCLTITSGITLVIITVDRYRKVCRPLKWQFSNRTARVLCIVSFAIGLGMSWPVLVLYGIHTLEPVRHNITGSECSITNYYEHTGYVTVYSSVLWILFVTTFLIIMLLYIIIGRQIFKHAKLKKLSVRGKKSVQNGNGRWRSLVSNANQRNIDKNNSFENGLSTELCNTPSTIYQDQLELKIAEDQAKARKSALIMFLISVVFIASFMPYLILRLRQAALLNFVASMTDTDRILYKTFLRSYWLNCAINPFIYCACVPQFRKECKHLWCKVISCK